VTDERREFQRLHLTKPADGWFGDYSIRLLDVSAKGALIEPDEEIVEGARALLRFYWRDNAVEIMSETVRRGDGRAGLVFVESSDLLNSLIEQSASELLRAQEANAMGHREQNVIGTDETLTAASAGAAALAIGFITWTLSGDGHWKHRPALVPDQPEDGFTVSTSESTEQVELLCRSYETGDAEARRLIRMLAELSSAKKR
jgi:hypothetical protein